MGEGVNVGVGVLVGVCVKVTVGVLVGVAVGVRVDVGVSVLVGVIVGVTEGGCVAVKGTVTVGVVLLKTFDDSGRETYEKNLNPLTVLFSNKLPLERQSWGYMYPQSGLDVSLSNGMKSEKLHG